MQVYLADLNHQGPQDRSFPYAIGCVASYALERLKPQLSMRLFKSPELLAAALEEQVPDVLGCSNYIWNKSLGYAFMSRMKARHPQLVTVMGGPNYPEEAAEQKLFLQEYPAVDFYIFHEGEVGFESLLRALLEYGMDAARLKADRHLVPGCHYLVDGEFIRGSSPPKLTDLDEAFPSPYLTGLFDEFFATDYSPLVQYTRGCPFSCTFCVEGLQFYSKLGRQSLGRFQEELEYIARRVQDKPKLHIADANFGMYKEDYAVCQAIAEVQKEHGWPERIHASTGKNQTERILKAVDLLDGALRFGAAIQSASPEVLHHVKRNNISTDKLMDAAQAAGRGDKRSYSDIILNLPKDSIQAHLATLRTVIDAGIMRPVMNTLLLLPGTEMSNPSYREQYGMVTRFRILPRSLGQYVLGDETFMCAEIVETVVASNTMSFEDFLECKLFDFSVEVFYTDQYLVELTGCMRKLGVSVFDFITQCHQLAPGYSPELREMYATYRAAVAADIWEQKSEVEALIADPVRLRHYTENEYRNSLATNRAIAVLQHAEALHAVARAAAHAVLEARELTDPALLAYVDEAVRYSLGRKGRLLEFDWAPQSEFTFDFLALQQQGFAADPRDFRLRVPQEFAFSLGDERVREMRRLLAAYSNPVLGMRNLLYRTEVASLADWFRDAYAGQPALS